MADKPESSASQYRKLLEKAEQLKTKAVDELKGEIQSKIDDLNEYGFSFRLTDRTEPEPKKAPTKRASDPNKVCKQCGKTGHDARFHRSENIAKKAVTVDKLPL